MGRAFGVVSGVPGRPSLTGASCSSPLRCGRDFMEPGFVRCFQARLLRSGRRPCTRPTARPSPPAPRLVARRARPRRGRGGLLDGRRRGPGHGPGARPRADVRAALRDDRASADAHRHARPAAGGAPASAASPRRPGLRRGRRGAHARRARRRLDVHGHGRLRPPGRHRRPLPRQGVRLLRDPRHERARTPRISARNPRIFAAASRWRTTSARSISTALTLPVYATLTDVVADVEASAGARRGPHPHGARSGSTFASTGPLAVRSTVPIGYLHGFGTPLFSKGGDSGAGLFLHENGKNSHKLIAVCRQPDPESNEDHLTRIDAAFLAWFNGA